MFHRLLLPAALSIAALGASAAEPRNVTLDIKGMTCPTCPLTVKVALKKQAGVQDVKLDAPHNAAAVTFDPDKVSADQLAKVVTELGYPATPRK